MWTLLFTSEALAVCLIGASAGAIELVRRYRDDPVRALRTPGAALYIAVNACAALLGLFLLQRVAAGLIQETDPERRAIFEVLLAGFGSLMVLRSSVIKVPQGSGEISVGPAFLLDVLLASADRQVDRRRAIDRAREISEIMQGISFEKAAPSLPRLCFGLMQNLAPDEQETILNKVRELQEKTEIDSQVRTILLGLFLADLVGISVLKSAVGQLGARIKQEETRSSQELDSAVLEGLLREARNLNKMSRRPRTDE